MTDSDLDAIAEAIQGGCCLFFALLFAVVGFVAGVWAVAELVHNWPH